MADTTKSTADQSLFVIVRDVHTNRVRRMAVPSDLQVGMQGNPAELQLLGRLSIATMDHSVTSANQGVIYVTNNDTIVSVSLVNIPTSGRITVNLPANPRNGQLHFVKDMTGTAGTVPIDVVPGPRTLIDQFDFRSLTDPFGSLALYWFNDRWRILVSGLGLTGIGAAPRTAAYLTLAGDSGLSAERRLNLTGSNLVLTDQGANASALLDLSEVLGPGAGTFTYATVTADAHGRVRAISSGAPPAPLSASYITINGEAGLSAERRLAAGTGLTLQDGGANSTVTLGADDSVLATLTGSAFSGPVFAGGGITGSLQRTAGGLSYIVAGANIAVVSNSAGQVTISATGGGGGGGGGVPVYRMQALAGTATTAEAQAASKASVGALYFDPTLIAMFSGAATFHFNAIVDSSEPAVTASVDLYDVNGIVAFPPATVPGSTVSTNAQLMTYLSVDLTSTLQLVTGSGVLEARLWKSAPGLTSSVSCRNASVDVRFT